MSDLNYHMLFKYLTNKVLNQPINEYQPICHVKHFLLPPPLLSDKYSSQFGGGSQYAYFHEEDETSFQLVDTAKTQKTAYQRNRMRFAQVQERSTCTVYTVTQVIPNNINAKCLLICLKLCPTMAVQIT